MSVNIIRRRIAIDDVDELAAYLAKEDLEVSMRFIECFEQTLDMLREHPQIGSPCEFWSSRLKGLRRFPIDGFRRYFIFYSFELDCIEIFRVLDSARNIEGLLANETVS